jgi:subtilisin family serine protease
MATGSAPSPTFPSELNTVLQTFGLQEARPVFSSLPDDEARRINQRSALGGSAPDQLGAPGQASARDNFVRLKFPAGTLPEEVTAALKLLPDVARAVVVPQAAPPLLLPPTDPLIGSGAGPLVADAATGLEWQWYLHRLRFPQAWTYAQGANVVVADIDWGCRVTHQELAAGLEHTYNVADGSADVGQGAAAGHGTAVLGIAGARANDAGMAGCAPAAGLWAIKADSTAASPADFSAYWAEAIDYVRRADARGRRKVIILEVQTWPLGGNYEQLPSIRHAISAAIAEGCVVCVAAGNGNRPADRNDLNEPFDPTGSILVGATAYDPDEKINKRAWFSNYGSRIVVSAPGDPSHDLTCGHAADNSYVNAFGGTSGATPKVAGAVALMLSVNPLLSHADVRDILIGTGSPIAAEPGKSSGVFLNAEAAVLEALRRCSETQASAPPAAPAPSDDPPLPALKPLHGMRRAIPMVLENVDGALQWAAAPSAAPEPAPAPLAGAGPAPAPAGRTASSDMTLRQFRESVDGTLTQQDRILIVSQAIQLLDNFYVHRPLKENMHAVRPVQRLRVLLRRLQQQTDIPVGEEDELPFHNTLTQIFNSVRDLHTVYQLPRPYRDYIAYLPFEVDVFYDESHRRRYLVKRVVRDYPFSNEQFGKGAELLYWNGMAIERAVRASADATAGSNEAARHARGISALTIRAMNTALPPDADFVNLEFLPVGADAVPCTMRQEWFVRYAPSTANGLETLAGELESPAPAPPPSSEPMSHIALDLVRESTTHAQSLVFDERPPTPPPAPAAPPPISNERLLATVLGIDSAADAAREARQLIFEADNLRQLYEGAGEEAARQATAAAGEPPAVNAAWKAIFRTRTVEVKVQDKKVTYGYIHISTFYVLDDKGFVDEFVQLLQHTNMPQNGLILDVRGNGGGNIWAAERLLQTLTAATIEPERLQFIATPGTLDLCRHNSNASRNSLRSWRPSLEEAVETGSVYSLPFALTETARCNDLGQKYYGPVVLLVDGNCYSATDIFAAGFQDHAIGKVLGVAPSTGAGGANVWEHALLTAALPSGSGLQPLPNQAGMRVAIRQCLRVGPRAGQLLEDYGVVPDEVYYLQQDDLLNNDRLLLAHAAHQLATGSTRSIEVEVNLSAPKRPGMLQVIIRTTGLNRLDFYIDGRPTSSVDPLPGPQEPPLQPWVREGSSLKLVGFADLPDGQPAALYQGIVR